MTLNEWEAYVAPHTAPYHLKTHPPLPADLQQAIDASYLLERDAAQQLGITRHEYRKRLNQAVKIIGPHAQTLVGDGTGI